MGQNGHGKCYTRVFASGVSAGQDARKTLDSKCHARGFSKNPAIASAIAEFSGRPTKRTLSRPQRERVAHGTPPAAGLIVEQVMRFSPRSITCPRCGMTSCNAHDIAQGYCGYCRWWTSVEALAGALLDGQHNPRCARERCPGCKVNADFFAPS